MGFSEESTYSILKVEESYVVKREAVVFFRSFDKFLPNYAMSDSSRKEILQTT
jgi:hypothetical protein